MTRNSPRTQAAQFYTLGNRLQKQLQVLGKSRAGVTVQVKPARASLSGTDGDIEALGFIVMMQAAKSAQEDLKAIMEQVKAINSAKAALRAQVKPPRGQATLDFEATFQLMATLYAKQLEAELEEIQQDRDATSELSEMQNLRLQMAIDRLSKMMSTLSNIMKKIADTSSQIVQNLK